MEKTINLEDGYKVEIIQSLNEPLKQVVHFVKNNILINSFVANSDQEIKDGIEAFIKYHPK